MLIRRKTFLAIMMLILGATSAVAPGQTETPRPSSQTAPKSLAERLGYPRDAKLLIVHADDLGMAHSINTASIKGLESGQVSSASIMVPCPWFPEIADYARTHPEADLGLHLTLTSEWKLLRWGPVLAKERVPSLFDRSGYLYPLESEAAAHIDPKEAEAERQDGSQHDGYRQQHNSLSPCGRGRGRGESLPRPRAGAPQRPCQRSGAEHREEQAPQWR